MNTTMPGGHQPQASDPALQQLAQASLQLARQAHAKIAARERAQRRRGQRTATPLVHSPHPSMAGGLRRAIASPVGDEARTRVAQVA